MTAPSLTEQIAAAWAEWRVQFHAAEASALWRAIEAHIRTAPIEGCGLVDKPGDVSHAELSRVYVHPAGAGPDMASTVRFMFDLHWYNDDGLACLTPACMIDAPAVLLDVFEQDAFDAWVQKYVDGMRAQQLKKARITVRQLQQDFPELGITFAPS